ncbi:hypothetical protein F5883DRAFT_562708 [Diaporthe sp. PMI_573]|nr:hypothetical protein F5883DRAFT_562708 [Diaporthaceae sp. PMI_573]
MSKHTAPTGMENRCSFVENTLAAEEGSVTGERPTHADHAYRKPPQEISDRRIDAGKLIQLLEAKFPGAYQIRVVRNVYNISAPADLSLSDIVQCTHHDG